MERRGRIPVAKFRTQEGKTRSRSRVREPDYNEQDPETDLFTLLEDNIALKEENKALKLEIDEHKKTQNDFLEEKTKMRDELETLSKRQMAFEVEIKDITTKYTKMNNERNALDKLHKIKVDKVNSLANELQELHLLQKQQETLSHAVIGSISLKSKLVKILPILNSSNDSSGNNDLDSLIDVEPNAVIQITGELMERLVDEFLLLKNSMNSVELQLYEANEKISELVENQHHLEEENETLRSENTNLTKVAKLLTENMKESVETSKKMETALIKLKQRNDELNARTRDLTDGQPAPSPSPTTIKANEEFEQIKEEIESQNRDHGERIVEMKTLMEAAIQKNTNDELKTLQLKLEILEDELRKANARAELAENELVKYKRFPMPQTPPPPPPPRPLLPPPPPPPMPSTLLYKAPQPLQLTAAAGGVAYNNSLSNMHNLHNKESDGDSDKIIETVKHQVQPEAATGVDALMRELKSGRVTLRRNRRRKTQTNDALQEMFQVLEISQKQNRDSKICINMHLK